MILASEAGYELVIFIMLDYGAELNFKHEVHTLSVSRNSQFNNYGADTHLQATGRTALFFAAENRQDVAISILLAYGADPHLKDLVLYYIIGLLKL